MERHGVVEEKNEDINNDELRDAVVVNKWRSFDFINGEGEVLAKRAKFCRQQPNVNCRVESFGRMCSMFDERRKKWVIEIGFGGLLNLVGLQQTRTLCYWLMSRVDAVNEMYVDVSGARYRLSANQVKAVYYLDRLCRNPLKWGTFPHLKVCNNAEIHKAASEDRFGSDGDFGKLGMINVAYGENHPREARDLDVSVNDAILELPTFVASRRQQGKAKCPRTSFA